jgi:YesN/AraC family two-component response regulator
MAKILIADDETSIVIVLQGMLKLLHHDVLTAPDGARALDLISKENVDLLITDIVMPNMDGLELIAELKKSFPSVKIIAISGGSENNGPKGYLRKAEELGVHHFLSKPFMMSELSSMIKEVLTE